RPLRLDDDEAVRLAEIAGELGEILVGRHADRSDEIQLRTDAGLDLLADFRRRPEQPLATANIEKRLVQAERLNERREGQEDRADVAGDLSVVTHAHGQKDAVRAEPAGRDAGHGAMDAELARFVRGGTDDAAAVGAAADDDRLAAQLRII